MGGPRTPRRGSKVGAEAGKTCCVCWTEEGEKAGQAEGTASRQACGEWPREAGAWEGLGRHQRQDGTHPTAPGALTARSRATGGPVIEAFLGPCDCHGTPETAEPVTGTHKTQKRPCKCLGRRPSPGQCSLLPSQDPGLRQRGLFICLQGSAPSSFLLVLTQLSLRLGHPLPNPHPRCTPASPLLLLMPGLHLSMKAGSLACPATSWASSPCREGAEGLCLRCPYVPADGGTER